MNGKLARILFPVLLVLIVFAFYYRVIHFDFVLWDDDRYVFDNPLIRSFAAANWLAWFTRPWISLYTPLPLVSYALDYHFYGNHAGGYHLTNLLLHLANTLLVYALFKRLAKKNPLVCFLAALLFAIHPAQAESVAWISQRKNLLCGFFFLAGLHYYARFSNPAATAVRTPRKLFFGIGALAFYAASILSKITAVMTPLIWLSHDIFYLKKVSRKKIIFYSILLLVSLTAGLLTLSLYPRIWPWRLSGIGFDFLSRPVNVCFIYLKIIFWPVDMRLFYPDTFFAGASLQQFIFKILTVAGFLGVLTITVVRRPGTRFWAAWFIFLLLPVCSFLPVLAAGHHLYLPLVGIIGVCIVALGNFRKPLIGLLVAINLALVPIATAGVNVWKDGQTLWQDYLSKDPSNYLGNMQLASVYNLRAQDSDTIETYEKIRRLHPQIHQPYMNLVSLYLAVKQPEKAEKIVSELAQNLPNFSNILYAQAQIAFYKNDSALALKLLNECITKGTRNPGAYHLLGFLMYESKDYDGALPYLTFCLQLNPKHLQAKYLAGMCLAETKKIEEALAIFDELLAEKYYFPGIYFRKGSAHLQLNQTEEAKNAFKISSRIEPQAPEACLLLGMINLSEKKPEAAKKYLETAQKLNLQRTKQQNSSLGF